MRNIRTFLRIASALSLAAVVAGCASYDTMRRDALLEEPSREVVASLDFLTVHYYPYFDSLLCVHLLGINPARTRMVPSLLKIENSGSRIVKVNLDKCALEIAGEQCAPLAIEEVLDRARRGGGEVIAAQVAFGLIGMSMAGNSLTSSNRSLEEDYHAKYFKPTLLSPGKTAQGALFNQLPATRERRGCVFHLNMTDMSSQLEFIMDIPVPDSLLIYRRN